MARNVLLLLGIGSIGWAMLSLFFAGTVLPDWMGLGDLSRGPLYIESMAVNVGLWSALGAFAVLGSAFQRLRLAAVLTFLVCLEVGIVVAASVAYVSEKTRIARQAKELKKAERAALEAALAAEHAATPAEAPAPTPVQQP